MVNCPVSRVLPPFQARPMTMDGLRVWRLQRKKPLVEKASTSGSSSTGRGFRVDHLRCPGFRYELDSEEGVFYYRRGYKTEGHIQSCGSRGAETCEDAVVSLEAHLRDMFEVELPPSYQTLQYQLCVQFAGEKLSTWITDRTDVFHSREGTPIGGCVANAVGGISPPIIFYRHGDTAFLKTQHNVPMVPRMRDTLVGRYAQRTKRWDSGGTRHRTSWQSWRSTRLLSNQ
ncbi:hypothetical protein FOZ63_024762 [Perkinsus olseni]|uniref:Uncharacterized protein n=1 Tax=Perkinsus olseni TaxID=32597 RepID=A0A7J6SEW1_PEROL|nr:hypothetical protein FOZ63_024762 [Perkinsus olseni]